MLILSFFALLSPTLPLSLLLFFPYPASTQSTGSGTCTDIHFFTARGDNEAYPGRIGQLPNITCGDTTTSCDYEDIVFTTDPSTLYCSSVYQGATNGIAQVTAYNRRCPNSKLVLAGYSLGGHIVGDVLGGGGNQNFYNCFESAVEDILGTGTAPGNMTMIFGDVRYTANQPYNVGSGATLQGNYSRGGTVLEDLNAFKEQLQSYCFNNDPICANGNDGQVHTTYMTEFGNQAAQWILSRYQESQVVVSKGKD